MEIGPEQDTNQKERGGAAMHAENPSFTAESFLPVKRLIEKSLLVLPEKVRISAALILGDRTDFFGAEMTRQGILFGDNRRDVFEIGSITKIFTALLLAQMVEKGILEWDVPIHTYLPFKLKQARRGKKEVTLKHLANHTSGLCHQPPFLFWEALLHGHPRQPFRDYSEQRLVHFLQHQMRLAFPPGTKYRYSNMGMSLIGYILALQTGRSYEDLLQTNLFQPLGMLFSSTLGSRVSEHIVPGLENARRSAPNWDMNALSPAGGIKSCAEDMEKFIRFQFSDNPAVKATQTPTVRADGRYDNVFAGLGWHILERPNREQIHYHGGGMLGYTAHVRVNVAAKCAALVLSNLGNYRRWQTGVYELDRELLLILEAGK